MPHVSWWPFEHIEVPEHRTAVDDAVDGVRNIIARFQPALFRALADAMRSWIRSYASPRAFQADWKWMRLMVPLQFRLLVEQVLWDLGGDWRKLVTGFRPIVSAKELRGRGK